jgi:hypothetical protein
MACPQTAEANLRSEEFACLATDIWPRPKIATSGILKGALTVRIENKMEDFFRKPRGSLADKRVSRSSPCTDLPYLYENNEFLFALRRAFLY